MRSRRTPWNVLAEWLSPADRRLAFGVALLSGMGAAALGASANAVLAITFLGGISILLMLIDARHFILPDRLSLPLIPLGIVATGPNPDILFSRISAALALWAALALFAVLARRAMRGEAFGQGDVKLIAIAGIWLSVDYIAPFILCAAISAIGFNVARTLVGIGGEDRRIAFGAYLSPTLLFLVLLQLASRS